MVDIETKRAVWKDACIAASFSAGNAVPSKVVRLSQRFSKPALMDSVRRFSKTLPQVALAQVSRSLVFGGVLGAVRPHAPLSVAIGMGSVASSIEASAVVATLRREGVRKSLSACRAHLGPKTGLQAALVFAQAAAEWELYCQGKKWLQKHSKAHPALDNNAMFFLAGGFATISSTLMFGQTVGLMKIGSHLASRATLLKFSKAGCGHVTFESTFRLMYSERQDQQKPLEANLQPPGLPQKPEPALAAELLALESSADGWSKSSSSPLSLALSPRVAPKRQTKALQGRMKRSHSVPNFAKTASARARPERQSWKTLPIKRLTLA